MIVYIVSTKVYLATIGAFLLEMRLFPFKNQIIK